MINFLKIYYENFVNIEELEKHSTIPAQSSLALYWLFPAKRVQFLEIFMIRSMERGFFDGTQWSEISAMISELKNQSDLSKMGINSLKKASRHLGIKYWKAKSYFRQLPKKFFRRFSPGKAVPKLTADHKIKRLEFARAFDKNKLKIEDLLISDESRGRQVKALDSF